MNINDYSSCITERNSDGMDGELSCDMDSKLTDTESTESIMSISTEGPLLTVKGMNMVFGERTVLKDINLDIERGLMVGLIGPNGCGKSTLMKCISKVYKMTSGTVTLDGIDVGSMKNSDIAKIISNVPAETGQTFGMDVIDMVMLGRYPYVDRMWWERPEDEKAVRDALKTFGIYHLRKKKVSTLSSGERQRTLIAKAYVQEPELMLVDEPTSHLDMKYKLEVMEYLRSMAKTNMTVIIAEHDISLMARYCDLCIIMKEGAIKTVGDPRRVITADLIREIYEVDAKVGLDSDGEIYVLPKKCIYSDKSE